MDGFLGVFAVDLAETPFADYRKKHWALYFLDAYGGIDGDHHKAWVIDQVTRILRGTKVIVTQARWTDEAGNITHQEYRVKTDEPSKEYLQYVEDTITDGYEVNEGIPP